MTNIRSAVVFSENDRVLSSSLMDESVLVRRLRSSDIHTNRGNRSRLILSTMISWNSVFIPEAVPCELPKDKGSRHEIDLKPDSKYCVMKQWPLPREQVLSIDKFFADRLVAGHVRE